MSACRHLVTRNSAIRSADPENLKTLEQNMKCIGSPVAEMAIRAGHVFISPGC